ncbi:PaaI family thioesterase [Endozoicomonas sp. Mp262]|uniref:PaaI family thioesterase n=1 Tax=Endozoicomonas sp. Mp262 TaxID=2919499 RepID=UPI0021D8C48B
MSQSIPIDVLASQFLSAVVHGKCLGLKLRSVNSSGVEVELPFQDRLVGNPETGGIHSGAMTTLMDTCCGLSALTVLSQPEVCPTLDLRMDFLKATDREQPVIAFAEAYHLTSSVIFTRGVAFHHSQQEPLAHAVGTFMRTGKTFHALRG